jgi:hypothetical protein
MFQRAALTCHVTDCHEPAKRAATFSVLRRFKTLLGIVVASSTFSPLLKYLRGRSIGDRLVPRALVRE